MAVTPDEMPRHFPPTVAEASNVELQKAAHAEVEKLGALLNKAMNRVRELQDAQMRQEDLQSLHDREIEKQSQYAALFKVLFRSGKTLTVEDTRTIAVALLNEGWKK